MKLYIILFICITIFVSCKAYINPVVDAERRKVMPQFLKKLVGTRQDGLNNITQLATFDYRWAISYSGVFDQYPHKEAEDYVSILFVEVPYFNSTSQQLQYFRVAYIELNVLQIILVNDGTLNDTYRLDYVYNTKQYYGDGQYREQKGLFYSAYYTFLKNNSLISVETVISKDGQRFVEGETAYSNVEQLCILIVGIPGIFDGSCTVQTGYPQYSNFSDCITKLTVVDQQNVQSGYCPDFYASNTTACRNLHAAVTRTDPPHSQEIHCPHTGTPSTVCIDNCRPVCDSCHANATCKYSVNLYGVKNYYCECKDGYYGNGQSSCVAKSCSADWQCGSLDYYNYAFCNTTSKICQCKEGFIWNTTSVRCECQGNATVHYQNGVALCLDLGRCITRDHCTNPGANSNGIQQISIGDWNSLTCSPYGQLTPLIPYNTCLCNYGFDGGFFTRCNCPLSTKRLEWSSTLSANVCLSSNECTANYQCSNNNKYCNFSSGPSYGVGICTANNKKNEQEQKRNKEEEEKEQQEEQKEQQLEQQQIKQQEEEEKKKTIGEKKKKKKKL